MNIEKIFEKALQLYPIDKGEVLYLYKNAPFHDLIFVANQLRKKHHPNNIVTWIIDRNVNITNVCVSQCAFCNFCRKKSDSDSYITSTEHYVQKIEEMIALNGWQLLLQGGMHPDLGIDFYEKLFLDLKTLYPMVKLHTLGPPEIVYLAKKEKKTYTEVLTTLRTAGMDSLPGAGAEILSNRVRQLISPAKCGATEWLDVMRVAHNLNIPTSATMMFGHIETLEERIDHLISIRQVQNEKPADSLGFVSFIPWPFQHQNTVLHKNRNVENVIKAYDYIRFIAISRIVLHNISNLQPSWLTVGVPVAQICLHAGANDFGSVMIEENVVSKAGAHYKINPQEMISAIRQAGFEPKMRNQKFEIIE